MLLHLHLRDDKAKGKHDDDDVKGKPAAQAARPQAQHGVQHGSHAKAPAAADAKADAAATDKPPEKPKDIWVNLEHIVSLKPHEGEKHEGDEHAEADGSDIKLAGGDEVSVVETPEEIAGIVGRILKA